MIFVGWISPSPNKKPLLETGNKNPWKTRGLGDVLLAKKAYFQWGSTSLLVLRGGHQIKKIPYKT